MYLGQEAIAWLFRTVKYMGFITILLLLTTKVILPFVSGTSSNHWTERIPVKLHIAACDAEIACVHGEELFFFYVYIDFLELCS